MPAPLCAAHCIADRLSPSQYETINDLDRRLMAIVRARSEKLMKRRRDDIKDEASDCAAFLSTSDPGVSCLAPHPLLSDA